MAKRKTTKRETPRPKKKPVEPVAPQEELPLIEHRSHEDVRPRFRTEMDAVEEAYEAKESSRTKSDRHRWKTRRRRIGLSCASVVLALAMCEAGMWLFAPVPHPYIEPTPNRHLNLYVPGQWTFESDGLVMPGVSGPTTFTINAFGFRSPRLAALAKPLGTRRVFCIGGSTTECLYIDDVEVWTEQLCQRLQAEAPPGITIDVINVGRTGDSTREHITMLAQRVIPFDPDLILVMPGINDLVLQMAPDYSPYREDIRARHAQRFAGNVPKIKYLLCSASQTMRRVALLRRGAGRMDQFGRFRQDLGARWLHTVRAAMGRLPIETLSRDGVTPRPEYAENLRSLVGICRLNDVPIVFVTQPAIFRADLSETERALLWFHPGGRRYSPADMAYLLDRYNRTLLRVVADMDVPVIDAAARLPRDTSVFYDDCHFNVNGCTALAEILAIELLDLRGKWMDARTAGPS